MSGYSSQICSSQTHLSQKYENKKNMLDIIALTYERILPKRSFIKFINAETKLFIAWNFHAEWIMLLMSMNLPNPVAVSSSNPIPRLLLLLPTVFWYGNSLRRILILNAFSLCNKTQIYFGLWENTAMMLVNAGWIVRSQISELFSHEVKTDCRICCNHWLILINPIKSKYRLSVSLSYEPIWT